MKKAEKHKRIFLTLVGELIWELINVFLGHIWNKIGCSILLFILAMICFFSPILGINGEPTDKPIFFYVIGFIFIVVSFYLIVRRWIELKQKNREIENHP